MPNTHEEDGELDAVPEGGLGPLTAAPAKGAFHAVRAALDFHALRILAATDERECSAFDLSRRFGIPIVACYRRLRELEDLGLVTCLRTITSAPGHRVRLFRSRLRSARITFEDGRLWAQVEIARAGSKDAASASIEETFDALVVRRKRSRAPRDLGDGGASLELVPHRGEGALDAGEAGG